MFLRRNQSLDARRVIILFAACAIGTFCAFAAARFGAIFAVAVLAVSTEDAAIGVDVNCG